MLYVQLFLIYLYDFILNTKSPTYSNESVAHMVITYIMNFGAAIFQQAQMLNNNDRTNFTKAFQHPIL